MVKSREAFRGVRDLLLQAGVPDAAFDAGVLMELAAGRDWRWREEPLTGGEQARPVSYTHLTLPTKRIV